MRSRYFACMATADALLKPDHGAHRKHFIFTEEHHQLRESIHSFVTKEPLRRG